MPARGTANDPLALVCGADEHFARPMAVTLFSALTHLPRGRRAHVFIVDGGVAEAQRTRLRRVVAASGAAATLEFVTPDASSLDGLPTPNGLVAATYLRLLIPDVVPPPFARAIYLDSDLLVGLDLAELWDLDMGGHAVMAVRDQVIHVVSHHWGLPNHAGLGLPPDTAYFNAGLLMLDLARWREGGLAQRMVQHTREHAALVQWADQDGLNTVLARDWGALPPQWNLLMNFLMTERWASEDEERRASALLPLLRGPCVMHFSGRPKPWGVDCRYPARFDWLRALWRSRWFTPIERARWFAGYYAQYYGPRLRRRLRVGAA